MSVPDRSGASLLLAYLAGGMFGAGLLLAGMTQPARVLGFLDLFGNWDPTLAFVMASAIGVHATTYRLIRRRPTPLFDRTFHLPTRRDLDARLLGGAAIFGVGWGLAGFCPGPALVAAASGGTAALVFAAAMFAGMIAYQQTAPGRAVAVG